ncbi:MAG: hypothetical protein FWD96_02675 [Defluviitaleaceae bacterium]|nr:hypothetical protein [Defluviitaleaceae bacterium]
MDTDKDTPEKTHDGSAYKPIASLDIGNPKHPKSTIKPPVKEAYVKLEPQKDFNERIQEDLIDKAYSMFKWTLVCVMLVFFFELFVGEDRELSTEILRILPTIITFALGFLFATTRK